MMMGGATVDVVSLATITTKYGREGEERLTAKEACVLKKIHSSQPDQGGAENKPTRVHVFFRIRCRR